MGNNIDEIFENLKSFSKNQAGEKVTFSLSKERKEKLIKKYKDISSFELDVKELFEKLNKK